METKATFDDVKTGVCYVHNSEPMLMTQIAKVTLANGETYDAFKCSVANCHVYFRPQRGYEAITDGAYRQMVLNPSRHPKCKEHDLYMLLMMPSKDGIHEWSCPLKSCAAVHSYTAIAR